MKKTIIVIDVWEKGCQEYYMDFMTSDGVIIKGAKATIVWNGSSFVDIPRCRNLKKYSFCTYSTIRYLDQKSAFLSTVLGVKQSVEIFQVNDINRSNSSEEYLNDFKNKKR
jgi:hypothetical protein